ncbi:LytTR family transcriptional regulator DNA-binding domain-containing protein [Psychroflexus aestuariivivens]|uniref:LytTR family transcriptional regulator DNA-binding domain-containing protein n=1 Tax=Psychroflexus aestuariivivens TaxID=1795040 RepID=UPI000FD999BD|nr:LytTR family transcriptional regulator DNA-binding domain-containing protein [Psychroflexus aestuariivivens]
MKLPLIVFTILLLFSKTVNAQNEAKEFYKQSVNFEAKNIDSSLVYAEKAYDVLKSKDTLNQTYTDLLNQYGRIFFFKKDYQKAYNYFERCFNICIATNQEADAYKVKVNMAVCQRQLDNPKVALEDLFEVVTYYDQNDHKNINLGKTYVNIADLYMLNKQHKSAENYYKKSLAFFETDSDLYIQLQGSRVANFNAFDIEKSLELIKTIENQTQLDSLPVAVSAPLYNSIAQAMVRKGDHKKGLHYTLKVLNIKRKSGFTKDIAIQYNNIGDIYIKSENYPLATSYLDSAFQTAVTNRQKLQILKNLQKAHKGNNNLEQSLNYADQYISLKDSLNEVLTQKEIAELGVKYQTNEKNKFIDQLQNLSIIYKSVILIILLIAAFIVFRMIRKNAIIKKEVENIQDELAIFKLNKEKNKSAENNEIIQLKSKAIINTENILYVKSDGHYVEYYLETKEKPEVDRNKLSEVLKQLPSASFIRIHNSYIVNIKRIKIINSTKVMLNNGIWINLSRTYKHQLKDILHKES